MLFFVHLSPSSLAPFLTSLQISVLRTLSGNLPPWAAILGPSTPPPSLSLMCQWSRAGAGQTATSISSIHRAVGRAADRDDDGQQRGGRCFLREAIHVHVREGWHYPARQRIMSLISSLIKSRTLARRGLLLRPCDADASHWERGCHGEITSHSN